jgi:hypothetical protein
MMKNFLKQSALAQKIFVDTEVILSRSVLKPEDLERKLPSGEMELLLPQEGLYELEVHGQVIALGRIVRRWGQYFFKIKEINKL